jgi:hypothetical protein
MELNVIRLLLFICVLISGCGSTYEPPQKWGGKKYNEFFVGISHMENEISVWPEADMRRLEGYAVDILSEYGVTGHSISKIKHEKRFTDNEVKQYARDSDINASIFILPGAIIFTDEFGNQYNLQIETASRTTMYREDLEKWLPKGRELGFF